MRLTNNQSLPDLIVRAIENDQYSKAGSDYSVTQLLSPPQISYLMQEYGQHVQEDASERIWSLIGSAVHSIIERAAGKSDVVEQRFYMHTQAGVVSGQIDHYCTETRVLTDFKVTSGYKVKRAKGEGVLEWEQQLNMQAALMRKSGIYPKKLQIIAICRDWQKGQALQSKDYPNTIELIEYPMWAPEEAELFLLERASLFEGVMAGEIQARCSDEERWKKDDKWAVMREGRKRALKLCDSKEEVRQYLLAQGMTELGDNGQVILPDDIRIDERKGEYTRCEGYCPVADHCPQFMEER